MQISISDGVEKVLDTIGHHIDSKAKRGYSVSVTRQEIIFFGGLSLRIKGGLMSWHTEFRSAAERFTNLNMEEVDLFSAPELLASFHKDIKRGQGS